jgi:hypothetical protein
MREIWLTALLFVWKSIRDLWPSSQGKPKILMV